MCLISSSVRRSAGMSVPHTNSSVSLTLARPSALKIWSPIASEIVSSMASSAKSQAMSLRSIPEPNSVMASMASARALIVRPVVMARTSGAMSNRFPGSARRSEMSRPNACAKPSRRLGIFSFGRRISIITVSTSRSPSGGMPRMCSPSRIGAVVSSCV